MKTRIKAIILILFVVSVSVAYWTCTDLKNWPLSFMLYLQTGTGETNNSTTGGNPLYSTDSQPYTPKEPGIFFVETTDRMTVSTLVTCSIESAARTYPDRPVYFLMKGLPEDLSIHLNTSYRAVALLTSLKNVHILPLRFEELFQDTPLHSWYLKVNPARQRHWVHHVSDACREALIWKYGGIYMDTDIISIRPIPVADFLAAQDPSVCSSAVLGFQRHHPFIWDCMVDFVKNYNGRRWVQQGPGLFTRMAAKLCRMPDFEREGDGMCSHFHYLHPQRFFPIPFYSWFKYFETWYDNDKAFDESYALHFWNFMNTEHWEVTAGSNTVAEHIFIKYCPLTYDLFVKN